MNARTSLQSSHDDLAHSITEFIDQMLRGSHQPTPVQWIALANALDTAALQMRPEANPAWTAQVAELVAKRMSGLLEKGWSRDLELGAPRPLKEGE